MRHKFRQPVDHGEVSRAWSEQGYNCLTRTDPPGQDWRDVAHGSDEVLVVIEGGLEVEMHGVRYALQPGDEMFIPREAPYRIRNACDAGNPLVPWPRLRAREAIPEIRREQPAGRARKKTTALRTCTALSSLCWSRRRNLSATASSSRRDCARHWR